MAEYAARGGRFGPHNLHENEPFPWPWQSEEINDVYVTADGIVCAVDRSGGGLYLLEYSGPG